MREEFEYNISLDVEDYADYNLTFYNKLARAADVALFWWLPFMLLVIAAGMLIDPKVENKWSVIVVLVFLGLSFLVSKLLVFLNRKVRGWNTRFWSKRRYKNGNENRFLKINKSGIESKGELTTFFCVWKQIVKLMENENALYVFIEKNNAFVIPKRVFGSIDELAEVTDFIAQQSGKQFRFVHLNKNKPN